MGLQPVPGFYVPEPQGGLLHQNPAAGVVVGHAEIAGLRRGGIASGFCELARTGHVLRVLTLFARLDQGKNLEQRPRRARPAVEP